MRSEHLSDSEIQQYATEPAASNAIVMEHISGCEACKQQVAVYKQLSIAISHQPVAAFDFDLSALVVGAIETAKPKKSWAVFYSYLALFAGIGVFAFGCYWYRRYFLKIFSGVFSYFLYLLLITAVTILVFQCFDFYRNYQKKLRALGIK